MVIDKENIEGVDEIKETNNKTSSVKKKGSDNDKGNICLPHIQTS